MKRRSAVLVGILVLILWIGGLGGPDGGVIIHDAFAVDGDALLVDRGFEANKTGKVLRAKEKPQGWYESRRDSKEARLSLKLSTKKIGGNGTHKAMIKGDPDLNTYLTQKFSEAQEEVVSLQWDIYVKKIWPKHNRSAFQMIGNASSKGRGPNASGAERFVFLGFENAETAGKINLFAFEGGPDQKWSDKTILVANLDLKTWYTILVSVNVEEEWYEVEIEGVTEGPIEVQAFDSKKSEIPERLTHVSFASWNDGPGTFYIDNVQTR